MEVRGVIFAVAEEDDLMVVGDIVRNDILGVTVRAFVGFARFFELSSVCDGVSILVR